MNPLIALKTSQRVLLSAGASLAAINNAYRADMVAVTSETLFPEPALKRLTNHMTCHPVGRRILKERPLLTSKILDDWYDNRIKEIHEKSKDSDETFEKLNQELAQTFGYQLMQFFKKANISLDTRRPVKFTPSSLYIDLKFKNTQRSQEEIDDLSYVLTRYRQVHDILHFLVDKNTKFDGEAELKVFEAIHTKRLPMTVVGGTIAPMVKLDSERRNKFVNRLSGVCEDARKTSNVYNVYFEERLDQNVDELRAELNL